MVEDSPVGEIDYEEEEEVVEALEVEVKQMAKSILDYGQTLPNQLKKSLATLLVAQRPSVVEPVEEVLLSPLTSHTLVPGILDPAGSANQDDAESLESGKVALLAEDDPETARKILQLKAKVSSNVAALPIVLKRVNVCISKIDNLETLHCPVDAQRMFHAMFLDAHNLMPKIMPHAVKNVDFVSGDGGSGSIQQVNFCEGGPVKYVMNRLDSKDKDNFECNYTVIESDAFGDTVDHISNEIKFEVAPGGGCICKSKSSYYPKAGAVLNEDELKERRERSKGLYKIVQDYLVQNPHVYA